MRGFGSVNGNRSPLFVVDGIPYNGNVTSINPEDIESTVILKDATATAIYGARGANGVVLINTKTGRGRSVITYESKLGFNMDLLPRYDVIRSPEEYIEISWNAMYNRGLLSSTEDQLINPVDFANSNVFSRIGISPRYNLWGKDIKDLIDPVTGKFRPGVSRLYTPEN
ncbi:TonB-dependent receptor plug domain-containing protein [Riemerella anatipestifer]|uniref:TonB-dependent receptor plug domain-containing protein n=1 Tax=Riemerella anatipestifer TaxID=34085 RepID=A0AAP6HES6_RIEAN|nr:TonB-dependent receptor plug domain-containing protein [Riemerella anatipestifer]MCD5967951.1 TonB-dependent receptor plug domain-containing protein [Riemerella anatipestifer]MCE3024155.1 TonB-dependent receptor plug domain-containing protein [Riemerella anatipestifer]MCO7316989.1 TonB-dependent receptor plug domain-containing protein [Riemerella anatipestifer]MCO7324655.1 TonB-dependent receptor plug domain-containing protein [Riemerella anatipestifer]MCO7355282.1 TonB-dependent receptor p